MLTPREAEGRSAPWSPATFRAEAPITAGTNLVGGPWRVKRKGRAGAAGVLVAISLLAACASGPTLQPIGTVPPGPVVQEVPGFQVTVDARAWQGRPRNLIDRFLPFLIQLKNSGSAPLAVVRSDFYLLDDTNRQYLPLSPVDVVIALGGQPPGAVVSPSVGVATGGGGTAFGLGLGVFLGAPFGADSDTRDIIPQALPEGPVYPDAEVHGFLYFLIPAPGYRTIRLLVIPRDVPGQPRLEFQFQPAAK